MSFPIAPYVTQVTAIGPLDLENHDLHDDPRA
jgi:hypothetical protein